MSALSRPRPRLGAALLLLALCPGCESFNRTMYSFNDGLDRAVFQPVSRGYRAVVPGPIRQGISNFLDNLTSVETIANDLMQGEVKQAGSDLGRFLVNTLVGFGGVFDPARDLGLERHREDFGQTLAIWGVPSGPYLVLPVLGPTTIRDSARYPFAWAATPWAWSGVVEARAAMRGLQLVDERSRFLNATDRRDESAIDPYLFTKEAWLQRRAFEIWGTLPPEDGRQQEAREEELDELLDDLEDF